MCAVDNYIYFCCVINFKLSMLKGMSDKNSHKAHNLLPTVNLLQRIVLREIFSMNFLFAIVEGNVKLVKYPLKFVIQIALKSTS